MTLTAEEIEIEIEILRHDIASSDAGYLDTIPDDLADMVKLGIIDTQVAEHNRDILTVADMETLDDAQQKRAKVLWDAHIEELQASRRKQFEALENQLKGVKPNPDPATDLTDYEVMKDALEKAHELVDKAEQSKTAKDFNVGLPLENESIRALGWLQRKKTDEYARVMQSLKDAKPKPDMTLLKQRVKAQVKTQNAAAGNASDTPKLDPKYDPVLQLLKDVVDYQISENGGIVKVAMEEVTDDTTQTKSFTPTMTPISDFVVYPVREVIKDNGVANDRYLEVKGILPDGTMLHCAVIGMKDFDDMKWVHPTWGPRAAIRPFQERDLRFCIEKMSQAGIPTTKKYTHIGWEKIDDKWVYLHAGGAVGADSIDVELPSTLSGYKLPKEVKDLKASVRAVFTLKDVGPHNITYPGLSFALLSPLMEMFRHVDLEPGVLWYIWGYTNSGKSTLLALLMCLFGRFSAKSLPASFLDTAKSGDELAFYVKDSLLGKDDFYPSTDPKERARMTASLEWLMRTQGNRDGRGRLKQNAEYMDAHPPRGLVAVTGEVMPLKDSSLARAYTTHIQKDDLHSAKLKEAQASSHLLAEGMVGYLQWLATHFKEMEDSLPADFETYRTRSAKDTEVQGRYRRLDDSIADMFIGFSVFARFAVDVGAITPEESKQWSDECWEALCNGADEQTILAQQGSIARQFLIAVSALRAQGTIYFTKLDEPAPSTKSGGTSALPKEVVPSFKREKIGWEDGNGTVYLQMKLAVKAVNDLMHGQQIFSEGDIREALAAEDLVIRNKKNEVSYGKKILGRTEWIIAVKKEAFDLGCSEED